MPAKQGRNKGIRRVGIVWPYFRTPAWIRFFLIIHMSKSLDPQDTELLLSGHSLRPNRSRQAFYDSLPSVLGYHVLQQQGHNITNAEDAKALYNKVVAARNGEGGAMEGGAVGEDAGESSEVGTEDDAHDDILDEDVERDHHAELAEEEEWSEMYASDAEEAGEGGDVGGAGGDELEEEEVLVEFDQLQQEHSKCDDEWLLQLLKCLMPDGSFPTAEREKWRSLAVKCVAAFMLAARGCTSGMLDNMRELATSASAQ